MFGVILYFLFMLAALTIGIWNIVLRMDFWGIVFFFALAILFLCIALYKLKEELEYTSFIKNRQKAKTVDESEFPFAPLDMVALLRKANRTWVLLGTKGLKRKAIRTLSSFMHEILDKTPPKRYQEDCTPAELTENIIASFEILLCVVAAFGKNSDECYKTYCDICESLHHSLKTEEEWIAFYTEHIKASRSSTERFLFDTTRRYVTPARYETFVQAICYMILYDGIVDETEYNVLRRYFFVNDLDIYPKTWEQFEKEY